MTKLTKQNVDTTMPDYYTFTEPLFFEDLSETWRPAEIIKSCGGG